MNDFKIVIIYSNHTHTHTYIHTYTLLRVQLPDQTQCNTYVFLQTVSASFKSQNIVLDALLL